MLFVIPEKWLIISLSSHCRHLMRGISSRQNPKSIHLRRNSYTVQVKLVSLSLTPENSKQQKTELPLRTFDLLSQSLWRCYAQPYPPSMVLAVALMSQRAVTSCKLLHGERTSTRFNIIWWGGIVSEKNGRHNQQRKNSAGQETISQVHQQQRQGRCNVQRAEIFTRAALVEAVITLLAYYPDLTVDVVRHPSAR